MRVHSVSAAGLDLIKTFEGFRAEPTQLHEGGWVIGYAHVRLAEAGEPMSEADAAELLKLDLAPIERFVNSVVTADINQSQYDALVSFCFSVGVVAFEKCDVLRKVNAAQFVPAACAMDAWRKSSVGGESEVFDLLIRRRAAEKALFLKEPPVVGAPSVFLRAEIDHAAAILGAPIAYGELPPVGAAPRAPAEPTEAVAQPVRAKLVDVLKSETATTLVLTQKIEDEAVEEITTAVARPVARKVAVRAPKAARTARFAMKAPAETAALGSLILFGLGLIAVAATLWARGAETGDVLAGVALAAPGVLAVGAGVYGMWKGPTPRTA